MKKKMLSLALVMAMISALAACGSDQDSENSEQTASHGSQMEDSASALEASYDLLRVATDAGLDDLEPDVAESEPDFYMIYDLYEPLFDLADSGSSTLSPCLASGYTEVSPRQWQVELHDDIYDWEGNHLTAEDVVFSFNWLLERGPYSSMDCFDSIEVVDTYSFYIYWTEDITDPIQVQGPLTRTFIFSEDAYNETGSLRTEPIGTGCFKVTEFTPGSSITLEANDTYWARNYLDSMSDRHRAMIQTITYQKMDTDAAVSGLEEGIVDICGFLPVREAMKFADDVYKEQYHVTSYAGDGYWYLGANTISVSKDLRNALFYGLEDSEIVLAMGGDSVALHAFGSGGQTGYSDELVMTDTYAAGADAEKAEEYLEASGYSGSTLELVCLNSEPSVRGAREIQEEAAGLGIKIEISAVTRERFASIVNVEEIRKWDLALGYVEGPTVLDTWTQLLAASAEGGNLLYLIPDTSLSNLYEALTAEGTEAGTEQFLELQDYVTENAYLYPVASEQRTIVYTSQIQDLTYEDGYYYLTE